jgi:hypothetical protein
MGLLNQGLYGLGVSDEAKKLAVWSKCASIPNYNAAMWRTDIHGFNIKWTDHGNRSSDYGWEIDHIIPVSKGGSDDISNLQALHWRNNAAKSDKIGLR